MADERLLSTSEVAERLEVTRRQAQRLAQRGRFPRAFRVGTTWVVPEGDVEDLEKKRRERQD